jgi:hypothetical protein
MTSQPLRVGIVIGDRVLGQVQKRSFNEKKGRANPSLTDPKTLLNETI